MKTRILLFVALLFVKFVQAENIDWTLATEGKIHSTPAIENGVVYIGSDDQKLYAINAESGEKIWSYSTDFAVKSVPLIIDNSVYITCGSSLHRVNKADGTEINIYKPEAAVNGNPMSFIDDWDYHTSSPFLFNDLIFFGDQFGNIQVFDPANNSGKVYFTTDQGSAIRTTVNIADGIMYFGDWDGKAYALDMSSMELKWKYSSYDEKPYDTFGAYVTQPIIYNGKLYMGARNYTFAVLDISDGSKVWDYTHDGGGWITGTPLFVNDTMYLGGSDNKEMIAFNPDTGDKHWVYSTKQNVFCEATYVNGNLLFTDGDSYNHNPGPGYLYTLDAKTGTVKNLFAVNANVYSSPKVIDGKIFFGAYNGEVYCFDLDKFIKPQNSVFAFPEEPVDQLTINSTNDDYFALTIKNTGEGLDTITVSCTSSNQEVNDACLLQPSKFSLLVNQEKTVEVKFNTTALSAGTYTITISATSKKSGNEIYSKECEFIIQESTKVNDELIKGFNVYPNPVNDKVNCNVQLEKSANVVLNICALNGKKLISKNMGNVKAGNNTLSLSFNNKLATGMYLLALEVDSETISQSKIMHVK